MPSETLVHPPSTPGGLTGDRSAGPPDAAALHEVFQNSTINALLEGVYDGSMTYGELRRHGDFGLGTFNALDGEMVAFDGEFYQIKSDGIAYPVADEQRTPFATVLFFQPKCTRTLTGPLGLRATCKPWSRG